VKDEGGCRHSCPGDDNVFGWRSFDRRLGETKVPDLREVAFDRLFGPSEIKSAI
jgi:hypothetical protein